MSKTTLTRTVSFTICCLYISGLAWFHGWTSPNEVIDPHYSILMLLVGIYLATGFELYFFPDKD